MPDREISLAGARIVLADTATKLGPESADAVVVCGSHGGIYPGGLVLCAGCRAVMLHDAGLGRDDAGAGSLDLLAGYGVPAATVGHMTARIGSAEDMWARGRLSRVNAPARALGCAEGQGVVEAAALMAAAAARQPIDYPTGERRELVAERGALKAWTVDSASQVGDDDAGQIVLTGSHGGLIGGQAAKALKAPAFFAAFNDAGGGIEDAGLGRLPALQVSGIAAVTVSAASARIGEGLSTYEDGVISHMNDIAAGLGARVGLRLRTLVDRLMDQDRTETKR